MSTKGAPKTKKRNNRSFKTYVSIVLKKRYPTRGMSKSARAFYDALAASVTSTLTAEALRCMKSREAVTLNARDIGLAGRRALPESILNTLPDSFWKVIKNGSK